jgi:hypothetical protein
MDNKYFQTPVFKRDFHHNNLFISIPVLCSTVSYRLDLSVHIFNAAFETACTEFSNSF